MLLCCLDCATSCALDVCVCVCPSVPHHSDSFHRPTHVAAIEMGSLHGLVQRPTEEDCDLPR